MPINPNIALGIQPVQQPNMLGQYAQVMGIKAAQQEMEGNESTRNYFSRPVSERGDPSQLLGTKQGQAAYKALNEGQIKQLEAEQKRINLVGAGAGAVLENPTMETFTSVVSNLVNRGIYTPQQRDQAFAAIGNDPSKIKAFVTPIFNQAISAEKRLSDITSRRNQDVASGASYQQAALAREKFEFEKANPGFEYKTLNDGSIAAVNKRSNAVTILQNPGAAPTSAAPPVNALTSTPAANLDALINPPVVNQPGAPTRANAAALPTTPLRAAPRPGYEYNAQGQQVPIKDPAAVVSTITDPQGTVRGLNYKGEIVSTTKGIGKPSPFVEKTAEAKAQLNRDLDTAIRQLTKAIEPGGMLEQSTGSGIGAMYDASMGFFGKATEGASAAAQLAPIADLVLKMVPRFEGPQSVKDVESYEKAAGDLANPKKPVKVRKDAAEVIIKLMTERRGQFEIKGQEGAGSFSPANTGDITTDPNILNLTTGGRSGGATVPQGAIDMLKSNPALRAEFDAKYGSGASSKYLGK